MTFDPALFGSKLKRYRELFNFSLGDVSIATGISEDYLSTLENGVKRPTGDEVLILADYYKEDYNFFISNEQISTVEKTDPLYRRYGEDFSTEDRWAVQEFLFLCECEEFIMNILPVRHYKAFKFVKQGNNFKRHGQEAAAELRQHLGYSFNQVKMNIYEDFRDLGFHIFRRQLGNSKISGLFIKHPSAGNCILVNYSEDVYRQRFTVAHETAHAILDDEQDFVVSFKWDKKNLSEVRANNFASSYLMPPEFLQGIPDSKQWDSEKAIHWASQLKVSTEALAYALKNVGLISGDVEEQIKAVKVPAAFKVDPELPESLLPKSRQRREELLRRGLSTSYVGLCFDAYEQGVISAGRMAEMLLVDERELSEMASIYNRSLRYDD